MLVTGAALSSGAIGYGLRAFAVGTPKASPLIYRGTALGPDGQPLTGTRRIQIALFAQASGGTARCASAESALDLNATRGQFAITLPAGEDPAAGNCVQVVHETPDLWVAVSVDGQEMQPRTKLGNAPFALEAAHAVRADHATTAAVAENVDTPDEVLAEVNKAIAGGKALMGLPPAGARDYQLVLNPTQLGAVAPGLPMYQTAQWEVKCPAGKRVIGGGCHTGNPEWLLWLSKPAGDTGWTCNGVNWSRAAFGQDGTGPSNAEAWAICATFP